jgi:hypothetical protein
VALRRAQGKQHVGPFEAVGEPEGPAHTNARSLFEGMITDEVDLFYGTIGQIWASSRTLVGLERKGKLENRKWGNAKETPPVPIHRKRRVTHPLKSKGPPKKVFWMRHPRRRRSWRGRHELLRMSEKGDSIGV